MYLTKGFSAFFFRGFSAKCSVVGNYSIWAETWAPEEHKNRGLHTTPLPPLFLKLHVVRMKYFLLSVGHVHWLITIIMKWAIL